MPIKNNFNEVFARLKSIIQPYAKKMDAAYDTETYYLLNTRYIMKNKQPLCFGGVRRGYHYAYFKIRELLFSGEFSIDSNKHVECSRGNAKKLTILEAFEPGLVHGRYFVSDKLALQAPGHALVKQQSHIERVEIPLITPTLPKLARGLRWENHQERSQDCLRLASNQIDSGLARVCR